MVLLIMTLYLITGRFVDLIYAFQKVRFKIKAQIFISNLFILCKIKKNLEQHATNLNQN